ncbi:hypothetical protein [Streptomyces sp. NPDC001137]|uniref:hypothetical protein n=1 Tax=Streptomyces sp. NPDC001137 TaxID=3154378 RepID=UPI00332AE36E
MIRRTGPSAHPRAGSLTLALVRRLADDQAHRQGTLLLNDGAGGSSIEQLRLAMRIGLPSFAGGMPHLRPVRPRPARSGPQHADPLHYAPQAGRRHPPPAK